MPKEVQKSWGKWHFATLVVLLYFTVVMVTLFTNQPADVREFVLKKGAGAVGVAVVMVLWLVDRTF